MKQNYQPTKMKQKKTHHPRKEMEEETGWMEEEKKLNVNGGAQPPLGGLRKAGM